MKAGSLHEKETQQGIAHFVEHVRGGPASPSPAISDSHPMRSALAGKAEHSLCPLLRLSRSKSRGEG